MSKRIIVHAGIHKTGSTSIQKFLGERRAALREQGIDFYAGSYMPNNHAELHAAAMRTERQSGFKRINRIEVDGAYRDDVRERVRQHVANSPCPTVLFSAEGLSYLRHPDEFDRLKDMLLGDIEVVLYLREAAGFLASYRRMLHVPESFIVTRDSFAYVGDDSWLVDYKALVAGFQSAFPVVNVLDYDRELRQRGNVIPSFLDVIGARFRAEEWRGVFVNRTVGLDIP